MVDDDDEVREAAAAAVAGPLKENLIAPTAADRLVTWMGEHFAGSHEFASRVVGRMVGQAYSPVLALTPAEELLKEAMDFDDSLFAAEDQNLFIDEIRETIRWSRVLTARNEGLKGWVEQGLDSLLRLIDEKRGADDEDGPLGWMSDQHVFAICARVVLCAVAVVKVGEDDGKVRELLGRLVGMKGVHGSLVEMGKAGVE